MASTVSVSADEAQRNLSVLLAAVRSGAEVTIKEQDAPDVKLVRVEGNARVEEQTQEQRMAWLAELEKHWATVEPVVVGPWTREELYERDRWK